MLGAVANHFLATYGPDRVFFTVLPVDERGREIRASTFASDNVEHLSACLALQMAKLRSGKVAMVAMVVRVFSDTRTVKVLGPRGRIEIPEKDLYMFRFWADRCEGVEAAESRAAHTTDATSGDPIPPEPGVHFASAIKVLDTLDGYRRP